MNQYKDVTVLITGVTGFIGHHLANSLRALGADVYGLSRIKFPEFEEGKSFIGDITNREYLRDVVDKVRPTYVFHLAASKIRNTSSEDFRQSFDDNLTGTFNLVEACISLPNLERFVFLGTCEEYGCVETPYSETMREMPVSAYSCSKLAATHLLLTFSRIHNLPVVILRPSIAYGPKQGDEMFIPALIRSLLAKRLFAMSHGKQTRDFVFISDLIDAVLSAALVPEAVGQIINVSSNKAVRIIELAETLASLIGDNAYEFLDIGKLEYRHGEIMNYWAENRKADQILGWFPKVPLKKGLAQTVDYYRSLKS